MAGKKGRSGGYRKNAGRPKTTKVMPESVKDAIKKAAQELAEEYGEPLEKAILRLIYQKNIQDSVKASIWKSYIDAMVSKKVEQSLNLKREHQGPTIYKVNDKGEMIITKPGSSVINLPEQCPDPAEQLISKKKNEKTS